MKDGTRELTNNQWLLKADADKLPATYAELVTLLTGAGLPFGRTLLSDGWTIEPDPLNKANLLKDVTAALYGLTSTAMVDDALKLAAPKMLLQSYTTAGTYTWTAPDINGDGSTYEIGVVIDGGGASGTAAVHKANGTEARGIANGGASGTRRILKMTVTPNQTYTVVVGAGGSSVTASTPDYLPVRGNAGGTSSFSGVTAIGGQTAPLNSGYSLSVGGQSSDDIETWGGIVGNAFFANLLNSRKAPYGGAAAWVMAQTGSTTYQFPHACGNFMKAENPFDLAEVSLSAGGGCWCDHTPIAYNQEVETMSQGIAAKGTGLATTVVRNLTGVDATSPGSGGGSCGLGIKTADTTTICTATSGKGAAGAIRIYKI